MKASVKTPFHPAGAHDELFEQRVNDSYKLAQKLQEPTVCPKCGAVYHLGRWQWLPRPADAKEVICTACHRIADQVPAGYVNIEGEFAFTHYEELVKLLSNREKFAQQEHPMERIMAIEKNSDHILVTTTDVHLARNLASALKSAFQGSLQLKYSRDENLLRAYWRR